MALSTQCLVFELSEVYPDLQLYTSYSNLKLHVLSISLLYSNYKIDIP